MPKIQRNTDCNNAEGCITTTTQSSVYANNLLISTDGSTGPPDLVHPVWFTSNGGPSVYAKNLPINKEGDKDTCGIHYRINGSNNVFTDAFVGAGMMYDNSAPYLDSPPIGAQETPPVGYEDNTINDIHVYEHNDDPEQLGSEPTLVDYRPVNIISQEDLEMTSNIPTVYVCNEIEALPEDFNWSTSHSTFDEFADSIQLSNNYTVYDLTIGPAVSSYRFTDDVVQACGLSQKQILHNLCFHANTVLEPMIALFGNVFTITSGFRNKAGNSQHNKGQATDIQFLGIHGQPDTGEQYFIMAKELRDNIDYDQFILEWFGRNPWFHVSSNSTNHRKSVLTQTSPTSYSGGLIRLR